jgi:cell division protease FtsH
MGRDMGHGRDYSEDVAAVVDEEVRTLVEDAHHEAWEILVEYRDVLDDMVLKLLDKETLGKEEVAEIFAPIVKRPERAHPTYGGKRPLSDKPPVLTPAELAVLGPSDLEDLARGRGSRTGSKPLRRRLSPRRSSTDGDAAPAGSGAGNGNGGRTTGTPARPRGTVNRAAEPEEATPPPAAQPRPAARRRRAPGSDPAS